MSDKVYPEWVQNQRTTGTTVKKVGNNYCQYRHSSKRVPGKKSPIPVDTYTILERLLQMEPKKATRKESA